MDKSHNQERAQNPYQRRGLYSADSRGRFIVIISFIGLFVMCIMVLYLFTITTTSPVSRFLKPPSDPTK